MIWELPQNTPGSLTASIPSSVSLPGLPKAYCSSLESFCCLARIHPAPCPCMMGSNQVQLRVLLSRGASHDTVPVISLASDAGRDMSNLLLLFCFSRYFIL